MAFSALIEGTKENYTTKMKSVGDLVKARGEFSFVCAVCGDSVSMVAVDTKVMHPHFRHDNRNDCEETFRKAPNAFRHGLAVDSVAKKIMNVFSIAREKIDFEVTIFNDSRYHPEKGWQRADIVAHVDGVDMVVEVQLSRQPTDELEKRTVIYEKNGFPVVWFFGEEAADRRSVDWARRRCQFTGVVEATDEKI